MSMKSKSIRRIAILLTGALCTWVAVTITQVSTTTVAAHQSAPPTVPIGFHTARADAEHLHAAQQAGGSFVVYVMNWANIEPTPGYFYWEASDAAVRAAEFYGLGVVARLDRPPDWAVDGESPTPWSLDDYATFVMQVVARYGSRLDGIILWNEPNLRLEWQQRDPNPEAYVALLRAGAEAARNVNAALPIFMAGLAFTEGGDGNMNDLRFLAEVYRAGGGRYFDGLALHPYGFGAPPEAPPAQDQLNFRRLEYHRQLMIDNGDAEKPIWITEMGWRVRAPDRADAWQVVTPAQQAAYLQRAIALVATDYPWIERMAFWQLVAAGDRYGFDFWQGAADASPAYQALVTACRQRADCRASPTTAAPATTRVTAPVEILAPDVIVRLGDRGTLHPHWVHLSNNGNAGPTATLQWQGDFFVQPGAHSRRYALVLETMQVDQPLNQLTINGIPIGYLAPRSRPDPTSSWVTQRLSVPENLLVAGANTLTIDAGPRNPAWQYADWRWENLQVRNIRLIPTADEHRISEEPHFQEWQQLDHQRTGWGGSVDVVRLRPGSNGSFWVTGNRLGEIWRAQPRPPSGQSAGDTPAAELNHKGNWQLIKQAGAEEQLRFNDVIEWHGYTLAATSQGLRYRTAESAPWRVVDGVPVDGAVVLLAHANALYAGFANRGLWRATDPMGAWQPVGPHQETILDLAGTGNRQLYVATATAVYQVDLQTGTHGGNVRFARQQLPALPAEAETQFVTRLYGGTNGALVARARDRLWQWDGDAWSMYGPPMADGDPQQSAVAGCCGAGTLIGGHDMALQQHTAAGEWQLHPAADEFLAPIEVVDLLWVGETLVAGGTTGVFTWRAENEALTTGGWQSVAGLPATVSDLLIDPHDPERWLAATPIGLYRSADRGNAWELITPPWMINDMTWDSTGRLLLARNRGIAWSTDVAAPTVEWQATDGYERVHFFKIVPQPSFAQSTLPQGATPEPIWGGTWGNDIGVSVDGGRRMQGLGNGLETLSVLDIWWHATAGQITIATIEGLYRSDDSGTTWFQLPGPLTQQTVYALYQTEDGTLWAGAADGLWQSRDYGVQWERNTTLPIMTVLRMGTVTDGDGAPHLWIGTEDQGWWISDNLGQEWTFAGLAGQSVFAVAVTEEAEQTLVVATDKGLFTTVWRGE